MNDTIFLEAKKYRRVGMEEKKRLRDQNWDANQGTLTQNAT